MAKEADREADREADKEADKEAEAVTEAVTGRSPKLQRTTQIFQWKRMLNA